ncbi:MAG: DPP IV N-terminal domain-containing protein, partial [bacterium]
MRYILFIILFLHTMTSALAQQSPLIVTEDDYARAESFLSANTSPLVSCVLQQPNWLPDDRLVYRNKILGGFDFIIADPHKHTRNRAFNQERLAQSLSAVMKTTYDPLNLPFRQFEFSEDGRSLGFEVEEKTYSCDLQEYKCAPVQNPKYEPGPNEVLSPNEKLAAFIKDYNLWVRDLETGKETQLTWDGIKDFGYATNNAGWIKNKRPVLLWSPQSDKIATFQHDGRGVGEMYLVSTRVGHPELEDWKYPLPGDSLIFRIHRVVIHLKGPRVVRLKMPPDPHRSTITDHVADDEGKFLDVEWNADGSQLAFVSSSRDHKQATLRIADPETGKVRDVMEETVDTFFESGYNKVNWHVLADSKEVIWFSQRDNWGHLYLYDLNTGKLRHQITRGNWNVLQLLHIDRKNRLLYFTGSCRESGDPYFHYLYRIKMDGSKHTCLTPNKANHTISFSSTHNYFVDTYSTPYT